MEKGDREGGGGARHLPTVRALLFPRSQSRLAFDERFTFGIELDDAHGEARFRVSRPRFFTSAALRRSRWFARLHRSRREPMSFAAMRRSRVSTSNDRPKKGLSSVPRLPCRIGIVFLHCSNVKGGSKGARRRTTCTRTDCGVLLPAWGKKKRNWLREVCPTELAETGLQF